MLIFGLCEYVSITTLLELKQLDSYVTITALIHYRINNLTSQRLTDYERLHDKLLIIYVKGVGKHGRYKRYL